MGDGGLGGKNRPEAETCVSGEAEERKGGHGVSRPWFLEPNPRQDPRTCRPAVTLGYCKREARLRVNDGITTRDFRLILGLENAGEMDTFDQVSRTAMTNRLMSP